MVTSGVGHREVEAALRLEGIVQGDEEGVLDRLKDLRLLKDSFDLWVGNEARVWVRRRGRVEGGEGGGCSGHALSARGTRRGERGVRGAAPVYVPAIV